MHDIRDVAVNESDKGTQCDVKEQPGVITAVTWVMVRELIMEVAILQLGTVTCIRVHRQLQSKETTHAEAQMLTSVFDKQKRKSK